MLRKGLLKKERPSFDPPDPSPDASAATTLPADEPAAPTPEVAPVAEAPEPLAAQPAPMSPFSAPEPTPPAGTEVVYFAETDPAAAPAEAPKPRAPKPDTGMTWLTIDEIASVPFEPAPVPTPRPTPVASAAPEATEPVAPPRLAIVPEPVEPLLPVPEPFAAMPEPELTIAEPEVTIAEPEVTIAEPEVTIAEPELTAVEIVDDSADEATEEPPAPAIEVAAFDITPDAAELVEEPEPIEEAEPTERDILQAGPTSLPPTSLPSTSLPSTSPATGAADSSPSNLFLQARVESTGAAVTSPAPADDDLVVPTIDELPSFGDLPSLQDLPIPMAPTPPGTPASTPENPFAQPMPEPEPTTAAAPTPEPAVAAAPTPPPAPAIPAPDLSGSEFMFELPQPDSRVSPAGAATQIADLLRAAHDTAVRLRSHAEVEIQRSVEAARGEVQAHKQNQMRVLDAEQAAAEQIHAEIVHNARLAATEIRSRAEEQAAEIRAAADAVLAQAAAHAHAAKALVAHNLAEIEAAKEETATRGHELINASERVVLTIQDLDDNLSERLVHTDRMIEMAQRALAPSPS